MGYKCSVFFFVRNRFRFHQELCFFLSSFDQIFDYSKWVIFKVNSFVLQIYYTLSFDSVSIRLCSEICLWLQGVEEETNKMWPQWLKPLLREKFFVQCKIHADSHKSECNMYCLDCTNGPLCSLCLSFHKDHHAIQVRPFSLSLSLFSDSFYFQINLNHKV